MNSPSTRPSLGSDLLASLMVAAFSMVVALGYARVFSGWSFVADMVVIVVVGHGVGLLLRRLPLTAWVAVPATALALAWTVLAVYYPETFSWAFPTSDTWTVLGEQLTAARQDFRTAVAPVAYAGGWDVLAAIGLAVAVLLADVFAFRADARAETLVPGGVLFVFVGAVGDERLRLATAVALVGMGVATTATLRGYHAGTGRGQPTTLRRWPVAVAFGVIVALAAGFVGPRLPGADAAPLFETSGRNGGSSQVLSPLVDIQSRITNRSTTELFRVSADAASYWRSSTLPEFDGTTWRPPEDKLQRGDDLIAAAPPASVTRNKQTITIGALGGNVVPAAPDPVQSDPGLPVDDDTSAVQVDGSLAAGDRFNIVSAALVLDAAQLSQPTSIAPPDPIFTQLPDDLPAIVAEKTREVTAGATSSLDAALRLEAWFQGGEFTYSLEVRRGHDKSAIESFLTDRVGYCEQFAGTYAAMLRTLEIPTRVAVGFTWGTEVGDGEYSVLGRNAHAWPEVWFDDIGWLTFEPTPSRGSPNAGSYSPNITPAQDTSATADEIEVATNAAPPLPRSGPIDGGGLDLPDFTEVPDTPTPAPAPQPTSGDGGSSVWLGALALLVVVLGAPGAIRLARHRRRARSVDDQLAYAWHRATNAVASVGVPLEPSDTPLEVAANTARHFPLVTRPMTSLADAVTAATYRAEGSSGFDTAGTYGASPVRDCRNWAKQIDRAAADSMDWQNRVRRYFTTRG
ncbi:MAG TPA: DUF3488 and transglutaminase-like domain-containing protein [Ilumatobacteraceae bacterium]|nr:DUF3488 and transglutaminase-like domain-containing protein [Ilumatobacteraceae bacterium]